VCFEGVAFLLLTHGIFIYLDLSIKVWEGKVSFELEFSARSGLFLRFCAIVSFIGKETQLPPCLFRCCGKGFFFSFI
jgi:hypothetical protein